MQCRRLAFVMVSLVAVAGVNSARAQQSDVSFSPSVSLPSAGAGALPGFGLTFAGSSGSALRASGHMALKNTYAGALDAQTWLPPWGVDADMMFALSRRPFGRSQRTAGSFAFLGLGASAADTAGARQVAKNWSYGLGTVLPLGSHLDLFADSRWRMPRLVLPTANPKPARVKEFRFGLSFHITGGGSQPRR